MSAAANLDIEMIWERIKAHEGDEFKIATGKPFTYTVIGDVLRSSRAQYNLPKSQFKKALAYFPIARPGDISNVIRGSSYVWAILHDLRIRQNDW